MTTNISKTKAILFFLFSPNRFVRIAIAYQGAYIAEINRPYGSNYSHPTEEFSKNCQRQMTSLRFSLFQSFCWVFFVLAAAAITSACAQFFFGAPRALLTLSLQLAGALILFGATIWQIGNAASASGEWLAEKVQNWLFRTLSGIGTYFLAFPTCWDAISKNGEPSLEQLGPISLVASIVRLVY